MVHSRQRAQGGGAHRALTIGQELARRGFVARVTRRSRGTTPACTCHRCPLWWTPCDTDVVGTGRRFALTVVVGMLIAANMFVIILRTTEPAHADDRDIPILQVPPSTELTTTTAPPETSVETAPPPPKPRSVPADPYAAEPIQEIGTIEIPKIGLVHQIFHGITMRNIDRGPSHWPGTAFPGEVGNAVFAGHRVTKSHPFRNIDQLEPGDEVIFTVNGFRTTYAVTGQEVVVPSALHIVDQTPTPTATLFACHPPGSARYRIVVRLALLRQ
jgi:sortase A